MTYRPQPKYASKDAKRGAWTTCDDCGFVWSMSDMAFQYDYVGGPIPQSQGWLRCPRCITPLTYQRKLLIIPPDPPPLLNTRPEPYTVEETNWLTTQDGDIFETVQTDEDYITSMPNPAQIANTSVIISATLQTALSSLTVAYLDLFNGDPLDGGTSILQIITGSATRTNVFSVLEINVTDLTYLNPRVITVTSAAQGLAGQAIANISHVAIYDAASAGTLLASAEAGATPPTIVGGAVVQFDQLGLRVELA